MYVIPFKSNFDIPGLDFGFSYFAMFQRHDVMKDKRERKINERSRSSVAEL